MTKSGFLALLAAAAAIAQPQPSAQEIRVIAAKAYAFAYPMVLMEFTRRNAIELGSLVGVGETNQFAHLRQFPDARFHQVIRPNADTLYSSAWLDLSKEPILLHVLDTQDRYYLMHFMDAWTETFSVPGKRTTGTAEAWFAIVGPDWKGTLPARAQRIDAPTNMVWLIGRTQTNNASDYPFVHAIQRGYILMPLSQYPDGTRGVKPAAPAGRLPAFVPPPLQAQRMSTVDFFRTFADLLAKNPPHAADSPIMQELQRIGIVPGKVFRPEALGEDGIKALEQGAAATAARLVLLANPASRPGKNGWSGFGGKVGRYGTDYAARAAVARVGLGALPPEDALYINCQQDSGGLPLDGSHRYVLHFSKAEIPPVRAFWSVTMYGEDGYFIANTVHRYAIGDRDPLKFNADGSLDLHIQREAPGEERDRNWLPAPAEKFNLTLRLYWPSEEILNGTWAPPPVVRRDEQAQNRN